MIKYQDFAKQKRLAAPAIDAPAKPNPDTPADTAGGSSTGEKIAVVIGILAAIGGVFTVLAPRVQEVLGGLGMPAVPPELSH